MPCQYYVVSKLFCTPGYYQQKPQRGMSTDHVQAITCVEEQFLIPDSQLREKWSSLSKQNSPAVNGAKC